MNFLGVFGRTWLNNIFKVGDGMILVSACLAGLNVRYDGGHQLNETIRQLVANGKGIAICPEVLGGLQIPREPAEIMNGSGEDVLSGEARVVEARVVTISGKDVTKQFIDGAYATLRQAFAVQATTVILKENSPSCGSTMIYDGTFSNKKVAGIGVTAALLRRNGIRVINENDLDSLFLQ